MVVSYRKELVDAHFDHCSSYRFVDGRDLVYVYTLTRSTLRIQVKRPKNYAMYTSRSFV
jgi:hypothetical protein